MSAGRRLLRRGLLGHARAHGRPARPTDLVAPPPQPVGAKLELTFACNLRCGFCYTDSPRHTLARTPELSDDDWRRVVDQTIASGVLEAVVTGGEPFMRRDLALEVLERLDAAGIATYLNTNGWFVDEAVADRLARLRGLHVFVSIDGATAASHDAARGVPGSWRRAVEGASRLLDRGVRTFAVQVVTPDNLGGVDRSLELFWRLGVGAVNLAPVGPIGAAARGGDWRVGGNELRRLAARARERYAPHMRVALRGTGAEEFDPLTTAPATFLVRPDGIVRIASSVPFSFGHVDDGIGPAWDAIRAGWDGPEVRGWIDAVRRRSELPQADLVPYLDEDAPVSAAATKAPPTAGGREAPRPALAPAKAELATVDAAAAFVDELALGRRYRLGDVIWTDAGEGQRFVRHRSRGVITRLNASASVAMAACESEGTPADVAAALRTRHPAVGEQRLVGDALRATRMLLRRGILVPEKAPAGSGAAPGDEAAEPTAALTS